LSNVRIADDYRKKSDRPDRAATDCRTWLPLAMILLRRRNESHFLDTEKQAAPAGVAIDDRNFLPMPRMRRNGR
jgi:hypothetical protein